MLCRARLLVLVIGVSVPRQCPRVLDPRSFVLAFILRKCKNPNGFPLGCSDTECKTSLWWRTSGHLSNHPLLVRPKMCNVVGCITLNGDVKVWSPSACLCCRDLSDWHRDETDWTPVLDYACHFFRFQCLLLKDSIAAIDRKSVV